jgi:hypothetical protein
MSQELRGIELEAEYPPNASVEETVIPGYVLYYVCEDVHGTCLYRRQDVMFKLTVRQAAHRMGADSSRQRLFHLNLAFITFFKVRHR